MDGSRLSTRVDGVADLQLVDQVLDALENLWVDADFVPAEDRMLFTLAVSEVTTNVAQHSESPPPVTLSVQIAVTRGMLSAVIQDSAPPVTVNWDEVELPDEFGESGRGLALTRMALDEAEHRSDEHGNMWTLRRGFTPEL